MDCMESHAGGAARCPRCAYRSNSRAPERHLAALWPPQITVVDLETGEELGVFETESEAAACIAFARLRPDQVEILSNVPAAGAVAVMSADPPRAFRKRARSRRPLSGTGATAVTGRAVREILVNPASLGAGGTRE